MIRVALFLVLLGLIAFGITWLADRPGDVAITWHGWRIETSLMVSIGLLAALIAVCIFLWSLLRGILRSPREIAQMWRERRGRQGRDAITKGLIAIGAGDVRAARRYSGEASKLAGGEPLTLLLGAQSAQLVGDRNAAEKSFRSMAAREDTKLLGLRGLFIEAQRRNDVGSASLYAEEAARIAPSLSWAGQAVLQFRCGTGDWAGALDILERNRRSGALDRNMFNRQRAVLLTARALAGENGDRDAAKAYVAEAVRLAPDLVPAAALAGRFLSEAGETRKAVRILEKAWQTCPHPDLAEAYAHLRFGDSPRDRLARVQRLLAKHAGGVEGALALSRAAIDAREFALARKTLAPHLPQPTQRVALLMADLEQAEGDEGRAREWTARAVHAARDPAWTADGFVSERWLPLSPISGRLDAFEWRLPLTQIASERPDMTSEGLATEGETVIDATPAQRESRPLRAETERMPARVTPAREPRPVPIRREAIPEVVPLTHIPDDPGPEPEGERDPVTATPAPAATGGWRRIFSW